MMKTIIKTADGSICSLVPDGVAPAIGTDEVLIEAAPSVDILRAVYNFDTEAFEEAATAGEIAESLSEAIAAAALAIDNAEAGYINAVFSGKIHGHRAYEYIFSVFEAANVLNKTTAPDVSGESKNILNKKAARKGTTEVSEAQIVWDKFVQFKDVLGEFSGIRNASKDSASAATTKTGVAAAVAQYHADIQAYIATLGQ